MDKTTIGNGLISLLFGIFLLIDRNGFARDVVRWNKRLGLYLGETDEKVGKLTLVSMGVILIVLGIVLVFVGIVE